MAFRKAISASRGRATFLAVLKRAALRTLGGNRSFTIKEKKHMTEEESKPKTSKMKTLIYLILGLILLTVFLELSGIADVAGKRETETIIDRPHQ